MTHLRKIMLEELQRRNYAETTIDCYLRTVEDFSRHFKCSPDRLGPRHIREYQAELFQKRKLSPNTVAQRLAALRFSYTKTLKKAWSIEQTPYPKKAVHLPTILSQEEVARLIDAARPPLHRTLLMALYATQSCSTSSGNTGADCTESPVYGCFLAGMLTAVIAPSLPRRSTRPVKELLDGLPSRRSCIRTRCVTASPRICSKRARICARFRSC